MADISRIGFGQVEPNHLSAQRTGQIFAQLPAASDITQLENGQFVKYDYAEGVCNFEGAGEWMLVFNEVKLYDGWRETYKDFAMIADNYTPGGDIGHYGVGPFPGRMVPRVIKLNVGDIYTTNCIGGAGVKGAQSATTTVEVGNVLSPNAQGFLAADGDGSVQMEVVKIYTMADGQAAVKLMRIK